MNKPSPTGKSITVAPLSAVLETSLYVDDLNAAEHFYEDLLGLPKIFSTPGRQLTFRCGEGVLLIFNPEHTGRQQLLINGSAIPLHGSRGAGHMAFRLPRSEFEAWRRHFQVVGIAIESEVAWPNGAHSIYFRDPAGNSLELATPDMWNHSEVKGDDR